MNPLKTTLLAHSGETSVQVKWLAGIVFGGALVFLTLMAGRAMFSGFSPYDDEGYVLISLRNFVGHGGLYRDVYTQYGPFPFAFFSGLAAAGLPLTHTGGRIVTVALWSGTAWLCAMLVGEATRSFALRVAVLAASFVYLRAMLNEPNHPGGLIGLITAALAVFGYRWIAADRIRAWALAVGIGTAALVLTKINVGVFVAFSAVTWWLLYHRHPSVRRVAPWLLVPLGMLLPLGLMRPLLADGWVQTFAAVFACSAIAVVMAASTRTSPRAGREAVVWTAWGFGVTTVATVGLILFRGSAPGDILEGVLLGPLRHPKAFSYPFVWPGGIHVLALVSLALCLLAWCLREGRAGVAINWFVAGLRVVSGATLAVIILRARALDTDQFVFGHALPLLWPLVWPLTDEPPAASAARSWVALLLLGQWLHAFPVAGSQIVWSSLLVLPLAAIGAGEALAWVASRVPNRPWLRSRAAIIACQGALIVFALLTGIRFAKYVDRSPVGYPLHLPGAERVSLPEDTAARYRLLTTNAVAHGDMLFSLPGMFSLNLWSRLPTPTLANATHWFSLLSLSQQLAIMHSLEAHPRACVIVNKDRLKFLEGLGVVPSGVLRDYLGENFAPAFAIDDFEFWVRKGREVVPLMFAELAEEPASGGGQSVLRISFVLPASQAVARVEIPPRDAGGSPRILNEANARVEITPIDLQGKATGSPEISAWPFQLKGPASVSIHFSGGFSTVAAGTLVLRDQNGAEIALARFRRSTVVPQPE